MKPYGLVLAGGGAKGAYQLGAWKAMREIGVTFSAVATASWVRPRSFRNRRISFPISMMVSSLFVMASS